MEPAVGLGPINELKEFLRVVRFAILVIDVESVFVSIDDHERNRHPERSVRVFVASMPNLLPLVISLVAEHVGRAFGEEAFESRIPSTLKQRPAA